MNWEESRGRRFSFCFVLFSLSVWIIHFCTENDPNLPGNCKASARCRSYAVGRRRGRLWVLPPPLKLHGYRKSRGGLWLCPFPKNSEWEHPSEDGQGKGKCGWDLACVLFVRFMTASGTYQKWLLLSVKCSHLLDNTSCLVLKQLSHSRVSSVIRNLLGLITEIHAPTLRCLPEA